MATTLPPTRQNLLFLKKRVKLARNGHKLLKQKHDSLVKRLLAIVQEAVSLRRQFSQSFGNLQDKYNLALSTIDKEYLDVLGEYPSVDIQTQATPQQVMGVKFPELKASVEGQLKSYSLINTNTYLDETVEGLEKILPILYQLAEKENAARILLEEISLLKRRINGLEHVIIPRTQGQVKFITSKLEELALQEKVTMITIKNQIMN